MQMGTQETLNQEPIGALTFAKMVASMLPKNADANLISRIARQCCKKCGMPGKCRCHEDVVHSADWIYWPFEFVVFLSKLVSRITRRFLERAAPTSTKRVTIA